jgi:hypothetical protein
MIVVMTPQTYGYVLQMQRRITLASEGSCSMSLFTFWCSVFAEKNLTSILPECMSATEISHELCEKNVLHHKAEHLRHQDKGVSYHHTGDSW